MSVPLLKPMFVVQASNDLTLTAHVQLSLPDGKFIKFSVDRDTSQRLVVDLDYHLRRQEKAIADAQKEHKNFNDPV